MKARWAWFIFFSIVFLVWTVLDVIRPKRAVEPNSSKSITIILIDFTKPV